MKNSFLWLIVFLSLTALLAAQTPRPVNGKYVAVKNGHLTYDGQRLRLWGTNLVCNVKRGGKDMELSFDRIADVGFNGIRLNLFNNTFKDQTAKNSYTVPVTVKGSDSLMDRLDYGIYLGKQHGMFFWFTLSSDGFHPGDYDIAADDGTRDQWVKMIQENGYLAMFVDERAEKAYRQYAANIINHHNPYTNRRYGDEEAIALYEIHNEDGAVGQMIAQGLKGMAGEKLKKKWNVWLHKRYGSDQKLIAAWGKLNSGEVLAKSTVDFQPILNGVETVGAGVQKEFVSKDKSAPGSYSANRSADLKRFTCELYMDFMRRTIAYCRTLGKGVASVAFTPTGRFGANIPAYYAATCGDFISVGLYGFALRPWEVKKNDAHYPWVIRLNGHPMTETPIDVFRAADKPYLLYECNDYRPNPYMIEFPVRMAAYAVWQDTDGAFWFNWDDDGYLAKLKSDADYAGTRMPMPDANYPNAALIMANDEALLAAIKAAGAFYKDAKVAPAPSPVYATYGKDMLFGPGNGDIEGGLNWLLRDKAWRYGLRVKYDPNGPSRMPPMKQEPSDFAQAGPSMQWSWKNEAGYFRADAPSAKMFAGFLPKQIDFTGLKISGIDRDWGLISMVAQDGKPLEQSNDIMVSAVSRGYNTGMKVTPEKLSTTDYWQKGLAQMCGVPGDGPAVVERLSAVFQAPWLKGRKFMKYNFMRQCYQKGTLDERFELNGIEPLFYARIVR